MTTTIQIEEESAIIPLRKLNEMKNNIALLEEAINKNSVIAYSKLEHQYDSITARWIGKPEVYFVPREWDVRISIEREANIKNQSLQKEIDSLKKTYDDRIENLQKIITKYKESIKKLSKKKWYQFVEIKAL